MTTVLKKESINYFLIFVILMIVLLSAFVFKSVNDYINFNTINNWEVTSAKFIDGSVENYYSVGGASRISSNAAHLNKMYFPKVEYSYFINGVEYKNDKYYFAKNKYNAFADKQDVENIIDNYKKNGTVTIYYNPDNPKYSVINNSTYDISFAGMYFAIICLLFFVYILYKIKK
tara:strand:- start:1216 stop:1737 length:522 start_codon:yes stop_codon:yes gene_type:complete